MECRENVRKETPRKKTFDELLAEFERKSFYKPPYRAPEQKPSANASPPWMKYAKSVMENSVGYRRKYDV